MMGDEYVVDRIACLPAHLCRHRRSNDTCEHRFLSFEFFSRCSERKPKGWFLRSGLTSDCFLTLLGCSFL
jgi:hypothetical protein